MSDDKYVYPSQEFAEMRQSGIYLLHDGGDLYECHICGSVVSKWRTHALWHEAQEGKEVRGD